MVGVGTVVAALEPRDLRPASERACRLDGQHDRLGPRIRKTDLLDARDSLDQQLRQTDLALGRKRQRRAKDELPADCIDDARMRVTVNQRGVVVDEVEPGLTVNIGHARSLSGRDVGRVWPTEDGRTRVAAGHDLPSPGVQLGRARAGFQVAVTKAVRCRRRKGMGHV